MSSSQQQLCREKPRVRLGPFVVVTVLIQNAAAAMISFVVCLAWKRLSAQFRLLCLSISLPESKERFPLGFKRPGEAAVSFEASINNEAILIC